LAGWCAGALRTLLLLGAGVATIGYARNIDAARYSSWRPDLSHTAWDKPPAGLPTGAAIRLQVDARPASVVRPGPTLLQTGDGHIWISREQDVWSVDPDHIRRNPVAPIVAIEGVMAANCDGVWSRNSAELRLNVLPAFYARLWFRALCVVAAAALLLLIFFIRLAQVHSRYRLRLQERHAERERIARDIHDTLLQGIQALLFRLQVWELNPSVPGALRQEISKVITQSIAIVVEGRERILMLRRTQAKPAELRQALTAIAHEESSDGPPTVSIHVTGIAAALTTDAFEQLVDIGREAIRNAYVHAQAKHVMVTLSYSRQSLSMSVTDDGKGIDASTLQRSGGTGHFGLIGMSERARQLHAQFRIEKNNPSGTRIMVVVPARTAYRKIRSWQWRAGNGALNDASPIFE
jgi:signal transduction histidine kinase